MTAQLDLMTPIRNHYYYGKLLDVNHFELETNYSNAKRWLLNRLVLGYGVICGLGVKWGNDPTTIQVLAGAGIDRCGREIIVPHISNPVPIPPSLLPPVPATAGTSAPASGAQATGHAPAPNPNPQYLDSHVVLCYHECQCNPEPVLAGDCVSTGPCIAAEIREQYRIEIRKGAAPAFSAKCPEIKDVFSNGQINYPILANHVTNRSFEMPKHCGITLANLHIPLTPDPRACPNDWIDPSVRRVVYSNDLLFDLLISLANASAGQSGK